jgi:hypothetical protein
MTGQLVNNIPEDTISEVMETCADSFNRDFSKVIYAQAIYRAMRSIAIQYQVLQRIFIKTIIAEDESVDQEIIIPRANFTSAELKFTVNDVEYLVKRDYYNGIDLDEEEYYIRYAESNYYFNYGNKALGDVVRILYTAHISAPSDYETTVPEDPEQNIIPVLPDKFVEEVIRRSAVLVAKFGMAKFQGTPKAEKYVGIYRLNGGQKPSKIIDPDLVEDQPWIQMKIRTFLDD